MRDKPLIFSLPPYLSTEAIKTRLGCEIKDTYYYWLRELSELDHTDLSAHNHPSRGNWVYFPWRNEAVHIPEEHEFRRVFFSRNFPIIEKHTQEKLWNIRVGSAGLSVGSNIAIELVKAGVHKLKIADFDTLAPSNNNRITGGNILQIGENKASLLAKKLYELNPYCEIEQFTQGLTQDNFAYFVQDCDVLIDEIDAFPLKNLMRDYIHSEKGRKTVLVTGADLGENPIVEIESYIDPKFGGRVDEKDIQLILQSNPNKVEATRMLVSVVGRENIPASFLQNFINIKKGEQTYWAQVGLAATAVAAKITEIVVEIARGNEHKLKRLYRLPLKETKDSKEEKQINYLFNKEFGYLPPVKRTIFSPDEAALLIKKSMGKRIMRNLKIGGLTIDIQEIPANSITKNELEIIHKARHSYAMWGDFSFLLHDPSDKKWEEGACETNHLIAAVSGSNNFHKTFALKAAYLSYKHLVQLARKNILPFELAVWKIKNAKIGKEENLWTAFDASIKTQSNPGHVAITSRFSSFSERKNEDEIEKEAAAMAFAAMQLFLSDTKTPDFILNIITPESLQKVFSIKSGKQSTSLRFDPIQTTLGLKSPWQILLDEKNPLVGFHKTKLPGYWAKNPLPFMTQAELWRKSAINLLKTAQEKYK